MKRGKATWIFFPAIAIIGIILITLLIEPAEAQDSTVWTPETSAIITNSDTTIKLPLDPISGEEARTIQSVLAGEKIYHQKSRDIMPVRLKRYRTREVDGRTYRHYGPYCLIGPTALNPAGGYSQERGIIGDMILYQYTNEGEVYGIECTSETYYLIPTYGIK